MSTAPAERRKRSRFWFPVLAVLLGAVGIALAWMLGSEDIEIAQRRFFTFIIGVVTSIALVVWFLIGSGLSWAVRLGALLLASTAAAASIEEVQISGYGQFMPRVRFRWQASNDDDVEAHRKKQGRALDPVKLGVPSTDFPEYRGRKRDGIAGGPEINRDWEKRPPKELWRQPIGGGYAAFAVSGNLAVTIEQRRKQEAVVGYDTTTGKERWVHAYDADFKEALGGEGPRATPTIRDQEVYSLGATGRLVCLDAATGKERWSVDILENNDNIQWGMSGSPLVYDRVVVVNPGAQREPKKGKAVVAYDRQTGKEVWYAGDTKAGYSSPMLATFGGKRQVLLLDGSSFAGYDADSGKKLWSYDWPTYQDINVAQPIVIDEERVFISSGYKHGAALLKINKNDDKWSAAQLWSNMSLRCKFTSPVLYQGHLYGIDEGGLGILTCVDVETGKRKWSDGRFGAGQLLLSGDLLVVLAEDGKLALVDATPEAYRERGRIQALSGAKAWNLPALAEGKLYLRNEKEMVCYDLR